MTAVGDSKKLNKSRLSNLESLPVELIEKIFLYSLNVDLPRASPRLATAVSNEQVYRLFILLAFWDNDYSVYDNWNHHLTKAAKPSENNISPAQLASGRLRDSEYTWSQTLSIYRILRPLGRDYVPLTYDERRALQSAILRCKWCTNDRIRRQLPDLSQLIFTRWFVDYGYTFESRESEDCVEMLQGSQELSGIFEGLGQRYIEETEEQEEEDEYLNCELCFKMGEFFEFVYFNGINYIPPWGHLRRLWLPVLSLREITPSLLRADIDAGHKGLVRGSFTDAHTDFLETLLYSGQMLPQSQVRNDIYTDQVTYCKEALQDGIQVAVSTNNPRALDILLKIGVFLPLTKSGYGSISDSMRPGFFETAARNYISVDNSNNNNNNHDGNDNMNDADKKKKAKDDALLCFCLLLYTNAEYVPYNAPEITQFAKAVGGPFGEWLLSFKTYLPSHLDQMFCFSEHYMSFTINRIFNLREPNENTELGVRFIDDVLPSGDVFVKAFDLMRVHLDRYEF